MRASSSEGKCLNIAFALRRIGLGATLGCGATVALAACPPAGMTKPFLEALKTVRWSIADDARRQALAVEMLDCLASPDPELRDELGFDALSHWMRASQLDTATLQAIRASLLVRLRTEPDSATSIGPAGTVIDLTACRNASRNSSCQPFGSKGGRTATHASTARSL